MSVQELIEIVVKANDQATETTKKVDDQVKKLGDTTQQSNQKAATSAQKYNQKINETKTKLDPLVEKVNQVGTNGSESFRKLSTSQQDSIVKFNMLDKETQDTLQAIREVGVQSKNLIPGADSAIAKLASMDARTKSFAGSFEYARSKAELMGSSTETLRGKLQVVGSGITNYIVNKWDSAKTKVISFGNFIKTSLGSALSTVRGKIESLGNSFGGLGGIISSAIGGLGMASISQLTVGLAMNRERMTALTSATMGSQQAGEQFVNTMDKLTDHSLVSLDDLGQAMSTIKMSTGMTNAELENFSTTVNDIGQRAILMGKSGEEAVSLMQAAGRGLNGEFEMLKANFGITKEQLEDLGWSGAADDVEGYQKALNKALEAGGSMEGMMNTTTGKLETLKKNFRVAGRHVGEMFVPYIVKAVDWLNSLKNTCPGLYENIIMIAGATSLFATAAPSIAPMLSAFDGIISTGKTAFGILKTGASTASAFYRALAAGEGIQAAVTAGFTAMGASELLALWPLALIAAAILAIGAVVYEVGKAFGWWSDVGSMLEAMWAGVQRLWSAFINHPDVQAALQAIGSALKWVWDGIVGCLQSLLEFFGVSTGGEFDVVRALIDGIGNAWDFVKSIIVGVINVITTFMDVGNQLVSGQMDIMTAVTTIWETLRANIGPIARAIALHVIHAFTGMNARSIAYTRKMFNGVLNYFKRLPIRIAAYMKSTLNKMIASFKQWVLRSALYSKQVLTKVVTYIKQLPGKVGSYVVNTASRIATAGAKWVSNAKSSAESMVNAVKNKVSTLPGAVYNEFAKIPGKIRAAIGAACSAAGQWGRQVVASLKSAMGIHSPGIIQNSVVGEFANTIKRVEGQIKPAEKTANKFGKAIINGFDSNMTNKQRLLGNDAGFDVDTRSISSDHYVLDENLEVNLKHELDLNVNLKNVPENVDENRLLSIVEKAFANPKVMRKLVESNVFQEADSRMKKNIVSKRNRSQGIWNI